MNIQFGTGALFGLPNSGDTAADPTPYLLGALQSAQVDFKSTLKKLFGQNQFPLAKARGQIEVTCKAKIKAFDPGMLNQLYFGQTQTVGQTIAAIDEVHAIPSTPFQVTVTNGADFVTDYGVRNASTGAQLTKVASAPATGQYSVAAGGVYTFAAADTGISVKISYTYTSTTAGTSTIVIANQLMGYAPEFRALLSNTFRGKRFAIELYNCTMGGLSIPTKQDDFWEADIDFEACTDSSDTLGAIYADNV